MGMPFSFSGVGPSSFIMAKYQTDRSNEMAENQMRFQERMSNTSMQRQVADLKAAGINPLLAANIGGASAPAGAMGSVSPAQPGVEYNPTSAIQARLQEAQIRQTDQATLKLAAETAVQSEYIHNQRSLKLLSDAQLANLAAMTHAQNLSNVRTSAQLKAEQGLGDNYRFLEALSKLGGAYGAAAGLTSPFANAKNLQLGVRSLIRGK